MKKTGIKAHMEKLRHPMVNARNCWGGQNDERRSVVLLVWQDRSVTIDGRRFMTIRRSPDELVTADDRVGRNERDKHIDLIQNHGYACFLINQIAVDPKASPRSRDKFQDAEVRATGETRELEDGSIVIEIGERIDVRDFVGGES